MRKLLIALFALGLLLPSASFAAITFDAATSGGTISGATTFTFNHTVTSTANTILFVTLYGGDGVDVNPTVSYNGVAMTQIEKVIGTNHYLYLYYLINPAPGTHTVSSTWSPAHFMSGGAASYAGVAQTNPLNATTTATQANGVSNNMTTTLTTTVDNSWSILVGTNDTGANTAGASSTARTNTSISWDIFDTNGGKTPAGSQSMGFNSGTTGRKASVMAAFSPYVAAPVSSPQMYSSIVTEENG